MNKSSFYEQLQNSQNWPGEYMFKIILKSSIEENLAYIKKLFISKEAKYSVKESSTKKFQSLTIIVNMKSPEEVMSIYTQLEAIQKDIILL